MELRNVCTVFLVGGFLRDHVIVAIFGRHISKMEVMASTIAQLCCLLKIAFLHQEIYPRNTNFTHNRVFIGNFLTSQCWVRIIVSPFFPLYFPFNLLDIRYNRCIFMARRASWSNCIVQTASSIYWVTFYLGKKLDQEGVKI